MQELINKIMKAFIQRYPETTPLGLFKKKTLRMALSTLHIIGIETFNNVPVYVYRSKMFTYKNARLAVANVFECKEYDLVAFFVQVQGPNNKGNDEWSINYSSVLFVLNGNPIQDIAYIDPNTLFNKNAEAKELWKMIKGPEYFFPYQFIRILMVLNMLDIKNNEGSFLRNIKKYTPHKLCFNNAKLLKMQTKLKDK